MTASTAMRAAKPIMAALPLIISAEGVKGPKASALAPLKTGTREAAEKRMKVRIMPVGSSANWRSTDSPDESSAKRAAIKPSMDRRALMISGAPLNAMTSPKPGAWTAAAAMGVAGAG